MTLSKKLELQGIYKSFHPDVFKKPQRALVNVSCFFPAGLCTGLLGHNGAGKTTTIRLILGLIRQDKGQVLIDGHKPSQKSREEIGFMPEVNKLTNALTCREVLDLHGRLFKKLSGSDRKER